MQKVFEEIINKLEELRPHGIMGEYADIICEDAIKTVKEVAEKYNDGWIPVSERLPVLTKHESGEPVEYIVQLRYGTVPTVGCLNNDGIWGYMNWDKNKFCMFSTDVIAWKPLPQPYKERE